MQYKLCTFEPHKYEMKAYEFLRTGFSYMPFRQPCSHSQEEGRYLYQLYISLTVYQNQLPTFDTLQIITTVNANVFFHSLYCGLFPALCVPVSKTVFSSHWSLHVLHVSAWVLSGFSSFRPLS